MWQPYFFALFRLDKEYEAFVEVEEVKARARQATSTGGVSPQLSEKFHEAETGRTTDIAAEKANTGKSGRTMETWSETLAEYDLFFGVFLLNSG